ncbi:MAG TPA: glucose-6-phosphate isomerase [Gemmatimonadaceae bacterium]|nr:glucose-6-phosphate isomerase [Gemmatimonadaceae bacterium]
MAIHLDFSNMMQPAVSGGISEPELAAAQSDIERAYAGFEKLRRSGGVTFPDLPADAPLFEQSEAIAHRARGRYTDVVVLGIGGSALGPIALRTALRGADWNARSVDSRKGAPRLHVLDNVDPETMAALLERVELPGTLWLVTSKSGGTAETMSQLLIVYRRCVDHRLDPREHLVFVTDPEKGALRALARSNRIPAVEIPPGVGGRFSVLSPVGVLPALLVGIDARALLSGAAAMAGRCMSGDPLRNPAAAYALLQWLADTRHGRSANVFMPYADSLRDFALWFVQLWAESLGKTRSDGVAVGQTPIAAVGATDQHSQVQLFMEGPQDKVVTFVGVRRRQVDLTIPREFPDVPELGYLGGHALGELLAIEQRATAGALAKRGRPNLTIELEVVDAWHVGGLVMLLELATAYAGQLYGVDAFNQPGVELGKQFAYAMLGRPGSEAAVAEWDSLPRPDPRWSV